MTAFLYVWSGQLANPARVNPVACGGMIACPRDPVRMRMALEKREEHNLFLIYQRYAERIRILHKFLRHMINNLSVHGFP